jgi:DNA-binding transcriptional MocR family regulator
MRGSIRSTEFRKAWNRVLTRQGAPCDYGDPRSGIAPCRRRAARARRNRGQPDDVVITGGSTQALAIVAACAVGDAIAVESPAYPGACATFSHSAAWRLPLTAEGSI